MFCWSQLQCLHQLFQSVSHLSQLTVPPVPSHRKWGIRITHGGYEKGICFTVAGDGAAEGVTWGWNERQPSTREENYERIAAGFELRLIRSAGRRHRAVTERWTTNRPACPSLRLTYVFVLDIFKGDRPKCTTPLPILRLILPDTNISTDMWSAIIHIHSSCDRQWRERHEIRRALHNSALLPSNRVRFHENK